MSSLILCEKPSQAMDIAKALEIVNKHDGYIELSNEMLDEKTFITWAVGHLVSLAEPVEYDESYADFENYPILIKKDDFKYTINDKTKKQFNVIKKLLTQSDINQVVIATDPAREGENIAYKILNKIGIDDDIEIKRLWLQSRDNQSIYKAFNHLLPGEKTYPLYIEGRTREIADWIVGMNLTRHYTKVSKTFGNNDVIHIGRVSTPTLNLIYQREQDIKQFKKEKYNQIQATINKDDSEIKVTNKNKFFSEKELLEYLSSHDINSNQADVVVSDINDTEKSTMPPKFFNLSTLQAHMNDKHKMSAKETLTIAQSLYEKKLISYPRSDSEYITESEYTDIKNNLSLINAYYPNQKLNDEITNSSLIDPSRIEDHYGILITNVDISTIETNEKEDKLYDEIVKNIGMNFMNQEKYLETVVRFDMNGIEFITKGKAIIDSGFTALLENNEENIIPNFDKNERLKATLDILNKETKPPRRLTEKTLLKVMANPKAILDDSELNNILKDTNGLGTAATRADIIESLKDRKYIQVQKNNIYMTKKGMFLCELVKDTLLSKSDMTAKWESYLNEIGNDTKSDEQFLDNIEQMILKLINQPISENESLKQLAEQKKESSNVSRCPKCRVGYIVQKKSFYGCTEYKNGCDFTLPGTLLEKKLSENVIKDLCESKKTNIIKGFKSKKGSHFDASLKLENNGLKFDFS